MMKMMLIMMYDIIYIYHSGQYLLHFIGDFGSVYSVYAWLHIMLCRQNKKATYFYTRVHHSAIAAWTFVTVL